MTLPVNLSDREFKKFVEDVSGDVAVRIVAEDAIPVSGGGSGGGANTYSTAQGDFVATPNVGAKTVTITGLPFTLTADNVFLGSALQVTSAGVKTNIPMTQVTVSSGVITFAGMTANFASGDTCVMTLVGPDKFYDRNIDVEKSIEQAPLNMQYVEESLIDATNIATGTAYYPSSLGLPFGGYSQLSFTGQLTDANTTSTLSFEASNDEDTTNADWVQIYFNDEKAGIASGVNVITAASTSVTFAINKFPFNYRNVRAKLVTADATNTVIVKMRRAY